MRTKICLALVLSFGALSFAGRCLALSDDTSLPRGLRPKVYAITNAKIVTAPGQELARGTIVIRNGHIEAVGADVTAPGDAIAIDGTGKTVYPGLIDCCSSWGFETTLRRSEAGPAAVEDLASEALIATKADNRKGLIPEFLVATALKGDDESHDAWRKVGVTARLVAPEGGILAGQSAVVSLNGGAAHETLLRTPFGLHLAFRTNFGGEYPRAQMGTVAHARQFLLDAQRFQRLAKDSPNSAFDPALEAIGPYLSGARSVIFEAESRDEIHRALDFAKEFGLKPIIFGGREAWKVADRLKTEAVPVIVKLNLAEPDEEKEKHFTTRVHLEHNRIRLEEQTNPAKLHAAGVVFAFGSTGIPNERAAEKFRGNIWLMLDRGLPPDVALRALTSVPAQLLGMEKQLGSIQPGKSAHLLLSDGELFAAKTKVHQAFIDGVRFNLTPANDDEETKPKPKDKPNDHDKAKPMLLAENFIGPLSELDLQTEIEADRKPAIQTGGDVLIRNATVDTVTKGSLPDTDILVVGGKIAAIGKNLAPPREEIRVIDARGMYVMPGIIDSHAHFAVYGGVNEFSLSVVPEVRIQDVLNGDDVQIYRCAAGGVTTARILHGSANCVGGQDAVLKMKYGKPARELLVKDAPRGVKFALGENVKRTDGRFPNTRLGVEAVLVRAFSEAREYQRACDEYRANPSGPELRRDLRLEALADILRGDLRIHCHCYRADEILMLLRVADQFGFKIRSLQHVLEGYKIAPEIAAHGCSCSLFSDWWAYKIEAFDAIPYAAALLHEAGATICLKSDSNELGRHLYQEAAKTVKYGGLSEEDALKAITLNPAKQLGLDSRLGSIEVGKDADLAIFNGHPLNSYARVEMTLVEGEVYFQRDKTLAPIDIARSAPAKPNVSPSLPSKSGDYVIRGGTVHPVTGPTIDNGTVIIRKGKIAAVGRDLPMAGDLAVVNAEGMHIYPGMIDAGTVIGLAELESAKETNDFREGGDFQPDLRASIAINPDSELIPVTRANGVLSVVTRPTGSIIAGQGALINLAGWVPREMAVVDPVALEVELPSGQGHFAVFDPQENRMSRGVARKQRDEKIRRLKDLFRQAVAYDAGRTASPKTTPVNPRLEALVPYARGQKPVIIQAQRQAEIMDALKLADELKLKLILSGATDAWKLTDEIKKRNVPVVIGPIMSMPQEREDPYDAPYACPAKLQAAGVQFCIRSEGGSNTRNLPYNAAMAVSYGLPADEGLKSVTLYPAQILGVADQLGSIDSGKRANLVITNGDMLQASSQVLAIAIDGKLMPPESKQTKLYERYRQRLKEVQSGSAPLGTN
ncbi:MAG: amidohydrolase family protein [Gemmataceae bacterium]